MEKQVLHEIRVEQVSGKKEELRRMFGERVKKIVRLRPPSRFEIPTLPLLTNPFTGLDDRAAQRTFRRTPLPSLADDGHPAAHAAPAVRGLIHASLQDVATADRVRRGGVPHALLALARRPYRGVADRVGLDHPRERRVVSLVRQRRGEGTGGAGGEADGGETRAGTDRFGAAEDRAVWS